MNYRSYQKTTDNEKNVNSYIPPEKKGIFRWYRITGIIAIPLKPSISFLYLKAIFTLYSLNEFSQLTLKKKKNFLFANNDDLIEIF